MQFRDFGICALVLYATAARAQTVTVTNVPSQHYKYSYFPGDCPAGLDIPSGQYPPSNHLERGHTIYNAPTGQWVYWAHYDNGSYTLAEVLVATSPDECGPYTVQSEFQPQGYQSRDENIFEDDDGSGYLITASNIYGAANDTMAIFKMTPDYLGIDPSVPPTFLFDHLFREAPAVVKSDGTYFLVTSQAAGWFPSQGGYATSTAMLLGWSPLKNLGNSSTWGGQSADIKAIQGTQATTYVLVLDHLGGNSLRDTGSLWLPLIVDGAAQTATLGWYTSWQVDLTTGVLTLPNIVNAAIGGTASASSSASANPPSLANDGVYTTRWQAATSSFPASWTVDLGSEQAIQEVNLSWYMVKGSEPYYKYTIEYSLDGTDYTTIDHTDNMLYGFTNDSVNFTARYVRITETGYVCQNGCGFYAPSLMEAQLVQAPPSQNLPVNLTVTPSTPVVSSTDPFSVAVTVDGGPENPTPSGKITLSGGGYTATYGLVNGSSSFPIGGGAMDAGYNTITVTYTPDPTSAPIYGTTPATGTTTVKVGDVPARPTNLAVTPSSSGTLHVAWTPSGSATSYTLERSDDGGAFSAIATPTIASYTDTGLINDTTVYCYRVSATNALGTSDHSHAVCGTPSSLSLTLGNFGFEMPTTSSYIYNPSGASWTFSGASPNGSGVTTNGSGFTSGNAAAPDGTQVAFLQGTGTIVQTLDGFTPGTTYTITVAASQRQNKSGGQLGNTFDVRFDDTTIASFAPPQASRTYSDYSGAFTATSATHTLAFVGTNLNATTTFPDNTVFLDVVRIVGQPAGSLVIYPQPASVAYGSASAMLTAIATVDGTARANGLLIFRVGNGDQMPSSCAFWGSAENCTVFYPTANLPVGCYTVSVTYAGDSDYAPARATSTLTVSP